MLWLPLKGPYKNLKRKSIEKKLTCFVCGFVLCFLKLLFYSKQLCFTLQRINSWPFFLWLSILIAFVAILEAQIFRIFLGSMRQHPLETLHLRCSAYCSPNLKLTLQSLVMHVMWEALNQLGCCILMIVFLAMKMDYSSVRCHVFFFYYPLKKH